MAVKFKSKATGQTYEGLVVTGQQNDTVGIVVWAGSHGLNVNQTTQRGPAGDLSYLPVLPSPHEDGEPMTVEVGSALLLFPETGVLSFVSAGELAEFYEEVH